MRIFAVNQNNDIYAVNGRLAMKTGIEACAQACTHAMKALRGEMQYSIDTGMPYFTVAWSGSPNMLAFEAAARATLKAVRDVLAVTAFSAQVSNNTLVYTATISTVYGATVINGNLQLR